MSPIRSMFTTLLSYCLAPHCTELHRIYREVSIGQAQAAVLTYAEGEARWVPAGPNNGLSRVHVYQNAQAGTYRVVGRNVTDRTVSDSPLLVPPPSCSTCRHSKRIRHRCLSSDLHLHCLM